MFKKEEEYQSLTVINNTNQFINFSVINGTTYATSASSFYSQSHSYLADFIGTSMYKQLLAPGGTVSGGDALDRMTYRFEKNNYNVTIFVCKDNTFSTDSDVYINKMSFNFSGDMTITIGSNGSVY